MEKETKEKEVKDKEQVNKNLIKVGITIGDLNGIGPEIIVKALQDNRILTDLVPVVYGSNKVISHYKKQLNLQDFNYLSCQNATEISSKKVNVINVWQEEVQHHPTCHELEMLDHKICLRSMIFWCMLQTYGWRLRIFSFAQGYPKP